MSSASTGESPAAHNARKDAERQRRLERLAKRATAGAPLAQGHWFGWDLICTHKGCKERHPATGPCVGGAEINRPDLRRARG